MYIEPGTKVPPWLKKPEPKPEPPTYQPTPPVYHPPAPPAPPAVPAPKTAEQKDNERNAMASDSWPPSLK